jgi:hypothetical protein
MSVIRNDLLCERCLSRGRETRIAVMFNRLPDGGFDLEGCEPCELARDGTVRRDCSVPGCQGFASVFPAVHRD